MHSRVNELYHWQPVYSDSSMFVITSLTVKWRSFLKIKEGPARLGRGAVGRGLLRRWAQWPSAPVPAVRDREPRPARGRRRGFHQPTSKSKAAIPSSGELVATHDYYRRRLGSTSSNSSCGSAEYPGEGIPRHPGLPRADPGHW